MFRKASLRADPAARAAALNAINGPIRQRRLIGYIAKVAADLAAKDGREPAACMQAAAHIVLQAEADAKIRSAAKRAGAATYTPNGGREVARRLGQISTDAQIIEAFTGHVSRLLAERQQAAFHREAASRMLAGDKPDQDALSAWLDAINTHVAATIPVILYNPSTNIPRRLLLGSGVVVGSSRNQAGDEGAEQGLATSACVVDELEEAEVERQLFLRDAPMRAQPGAQQQPEAFHRVDVHLAKAVPILVAGILAAPMADGLVPVAPGWQAGVDAILVRVDKGARGDRGGDDWLDRPLLHVGQHVQHDLATGLY